MCFTPRFHNLYTRKNNILTNAALLVIISVLKWRSSSVLHYLPGGAKEFLVRASYLEIYNEGIRDLLAKVRVVIGGGGSFGILSIRALL